MANMVWEADDIFYNRKNDFYKVYKGEELYWEKELEGEREYLNFTSIEDGSFIGWVNHDTGELIDSEIYYSYNKDTWTLLDSNGITLNNGDVVYMKSIVSLQYNQFLTSVTKYGTQHFTITGKVNGNGVCTSLVYGNPEVYKMELFNYPSTQFYDYENATFQNLFHSCTGLIVAPQIGFSRDSYLSIDCLGGMFYGCSNLISTPNLPYMNLRRGCYGGIFYNCTSLVTAPQLPATNLGDFCYVDAFNGCTSLKEMPYLPATTIRSYTYERMFCGCTSLTSVIDLPATTLASYAYSEMFKGCYNITSVPSVLPAIKTKYESSYAYYSMFEGCTSLVTAPELLNTMVYSHAYERMFYGCTSLVTAPPRICASIEFYPAEYACVSMFEGCTSLVTAPELPDTIVPKFAYERMFYGCTSLVTAPPRINSKNIAYGACRSMFEGCTSLVTAPELLATTLEMYAYERMFYGCRNLDYLHCSVIPNWGLDRYGLYTGNWLDGVSPTGTFVKSSKAWNWIRGASGIPEGWEVEDD